MKRPKRCFLISSASSLACTCAFIVCVRSAADTAVGSVRTHTSSLLYMVYSLKRFHFLRSRCAINKKAIPTLYSNGTHGYLSPRLQRTGPLPCVCVCFFLTSIDRAIRLTNEKTSVVAGTCKSSTLSDRDSLGDPRRIPFLLPDRYFFHHHRLCTFPNGLFACRVPVPPTLLLISAQFPWVNGL